MARDDFSAETKRALCDRTGGLCSRPQCRRPTKGPAATSRSHVISIGVAAHIKGASPGGPRYDATQSSAERSSIENGVWLCESCGALVDKVRGDDFTAEMLARWKIEAEGLARDRLLLEERSLVERLTGMVCYANIHRLVELALSAGLRVAVPSTLTDEFPRNGLAIAELNFISDLLGEIPFLSRDIDAVDLPNAQGALVRFEKNCRTKNGVSPDEIDQAKHVGTPDGPHFYFMAGTEKCVVPYEPKWVTTTTGFVTFRAGHAKLAGFARVKFMLDDKAILSPLIVGLPRHPVWDW